MVLTCRFILLILIVILVAAPFKSSTKDKGCCVDSGQDVPTVNFCDLAAHPEDYDDKVVRVRAKYLTTVDWDTMYDLKCAGQDNYIQPYLDCNSDESCRLLKAKLGRDLSGDPFIGSRAELVVIGRVKKIEKLSRSASDLKKTKTGLYITQIVHTTPIPSDEPFPWDVKK